MLYVSTRNNIDSFTAYRTLHEDHAPDGGMFVPMRFPAFSQLDLDRFLTATFGDTVASVLNLFFPADLTGWDIDSCIGRHPFKLVNKSHKLIIAELWHNHELIYDYLEERIYKKLCLGEVIHRHPTASAKIAIRIAVLCGVWGEIMTTESSPVDIAVMTGDDSAFIAAWYAKRMGLPIGKIICSCQDNGLLWDLVRRGEVNISTSQNEIPAYLERLIFDVFGLNETKNFLNASGARRSLQANDRLGELSNAVFASVIGENRTDSLTSSIFRSCGYVADRSVALSFGGLQNYRAQSGCSNLTVLLSQNSVSQRS